ncbi:phosphoribosylformylglycinamidine synthase [Treponema sp. OMZ 840]|uniref:phosphoribosylformylglycinamidine synthase n=1 Tax=Treponema sp. OMZ 840 TaxID=244313 RepID=UPI003D8C6DBF
MFRIYIERKDGFQNEAERIYDDLTGFLGISGIKKLRFINRYDIENVDSETFRKAVRCVFSEPQSDLCCFEQPPSTEGNTVIIWEYLPGQYDQRSDSAQQCLSLLEKDTLAQSGGEKPIVKCAKMVVIDGNISETDIGRIKSYLINPVDSREASSTLPQTLKTELLMPGKISRIDGFIAMNQEDLSVLASSMSLAMDNADLLFLQDYFKNIGRNPSETEIRVLDTYWSDHCRHTTFNTLLESIDIEDGFFADSFKASLKEYESMRNEVYGLSAREPSLMDMACIGAKYFKKRGLLEDVEISKEINACSVYIDVECENPKTSEKWLLMFKNETHNHPTEIEPFGGAATCIGGAIRDPLSGRSWVYQSLRVTGAADPRTPADKTRPGKLPQLKLTREAASGFSSYGNQIGLATGQVTEIYDSGFEAKRMELGAVIAAAPASSVKREEPEAGDCVILVGGGTGRDGIGGATGSSKVHTKASVTQAAAEVQKGNAVEERKIQRLFRNPQVSALIRRCNDFGAGGVAVAVGELADGLEINLDAVPKKYEGLNGTELAISESQERMAVVVKDKDAETFIAAAAAENLNAVVIAKITDSKRLVMKWQGDTIVDLDRTFLDSAGSARRASARISAPDKDKSPLNRPSDAVFTVLKTKGIKEAWFACLSDLAVCSQRGLSERFDGSIGAATVLFPMGGRFQATPEIGCAAKIPVPYPKQTKTASLMAFGYDPRISSWSPWHGAQYAVVQSLTRIVCMGGRSENCRLSFQEYFESAVSPHSWGKPAAALLGALSAQKAMGIAAIGGKDSMSGSFEDIHVPPTLVSFAVDTVDVNMISGGAFTRPANNVYMFKLAVQADGAPDYASFKENCRFLYKLRLLQAVCSAYPVESGGIAAAVSKMCFGNRIGFDFDGSFIKTYGAEYGFAPLYGSFIIETALDTDEITRLAAEYGFIPPIFLGKTCEQARIIWENSSIDIEEALKCWEKPLSSVFAPVSNKKPEQAVLNGLSAMPDFALHKHVSAQQAPSERRRMKKRFSVHMKEAPAVLLPVFPGTNCEYDMAHAFSLAGAKPEIFVFCNNSPQALRESLSAFERKLKNCRILALSGGFSAGDEPDGSGKFIANILRQPRIADAVYSLLQKDGLILGICNGFQALIKTGLLPYGEIREPSETAPTLTFNTLGRHISRMCTTRTVSFVSPWAHDSSILSGELHTIAVSHGEGRLLISTAEAEALFKNGQVFSQYTDINGMPALYEPDNPNGSAFAIEGLTSPDGRILGKMGHSERGISGIKGSVLKNIGGNKEQNIFAAGVQYFM